MPPTTKQVTYRRTLIERALRDAPPLGSAGPSLRAQAAATTALILSLPEPVSEQEASEQIDALKSGTILSYAKLHREWAAPIMARLAAKLGPTGEHIPPRRPDGGEWTPAEWREYIRDIL